LFQNFLTRVIMGEKKKHSIPQRKIAQKPNVI
jgi:hypothetical protein